MNQEFYCSMRSKAEIYVKVAGQRRKEVITDNFDAR
jgi:hypothetical protein